MKKFLFILLSLCLILTVLPISASAADYSKYGCTDCVVLVGDEVLPLPEFPVGSYATSNGEACVPGAHYRCLSTYPLPNGDSVYVYGKQCFGFARYVFYRLFGVVDTTFTGKGGYYSVVEDLHSVTAESLQELFQSDKVLPGAHYRVSRSSSADEGHSMIYLKSDEKYIYTYECNFKHTCDVSVICRTWQQMADFTNAKGGIGFIHMPDVYPDSFQWDCAINGHNWKMAADYAQTGLHEGLFHGTCMICGEHKLEIRPAGLCAMEKTCSGHSFTDMPSAEVWSHNAIEYVIEYGLLSGIGANQFSPDGTMTRAMLVNVLWRIAGQARVQTENPFSDVVAGSWYADSVIWANENRIVEGDGQGHFLPNDSVSREQMALILQNFSNWRGMDTQQEQSLADFADHTAVSSWAESAMCWAVAAELISGRQNGNQTLLNPQGKASRAEVSSVLMRYMKPEYDTQLRGAVVNSDNVNIRSGPGTRYARVSEADTGTEVLILLECDGWCRIRTRKGTIGYIFAIYLEAL